MKAIRISNLSYSYQRSVSETPVLSNISLEIEQGEFVAIQGPSGSGKSTLLYLLGCLLRPQEGKVEVLGDNISCITDNHLAELRNKKIGFIFQQFHLLPKTTVLNNIILPTLYSQPSQSKSIIKAKELVEMLDLSDRLEYMPNQLSGGQQQRVAIARALINNPDIILADEPTGNLDSKNASQIMELFRRLNRDLKKTIIVITHDNDIAKQCDRVIKVKDGCIVDGQISSNSVIQENVPKNKKRKDPKNFFNLLKSVRGHFPEALHNLARNKIRTALTMVGISVGIAAVLSMITLGQFTEKKILAGYAEMGVNTLLFYGYPNWDQKATDVVPVIFHSFDWERDILPLKKVFSQIHSMSPLIMGWDGSANFGGRLIDTDVRITGINEQALYIFKRKFLFGRNFIPADIKNKNQVCVVGYEIGQLLFGTIFPLGHVLRLTQGDNSFGCRVIGVLDTVSSNKEWSKPNLQVFVPFTSFQALSGDYWSSQIRQVLIQVDVDSEIEKVGSGIRVFFEQKYGRSGRFRVDSDTILVAQMKRFLTLFTFLLATVATVTLAIGGIGITNMMLVSVSERFREIGLRKALGATSDSIKIQFLTESVLICFFAGIIGLFLGVAIYHVVIWGASKFVTNLHFEWTFNFMAFTFSIFSIFIVGILSGLFPAIKAEKLQVVEALRSE
ncbi:MAG: hypothetical protein A2577_08995 [Bdellovibrionales bacterium RIFOXYD1_FULL_36_51]|nr:MAG: hypothetical protein A2577_08995 [Bdellovibrionales bacterium RIFOXYD1_FULL_36_51]